MKHADLSIQRTPRVFEQVAQQIIDFIIEQKLPAGSRLPTERQLSQVLKVSRSSIRESIKTLELFGFIFSIQGRGTFVKDPPFFIVPGNQFKFSINEDKLHGYYNIFVMCSEKIVLTCMTNKLNIDFNKLNDIDDRYHDFWAFFNKWLTLLGENLKQLQVYKLWKSVQSLLDSHSFFNQFTVNQDISFFFSAFKNSDVLQMINLFDELEAK